MFKHISNENGFLEDLILTVMLWVILATVAIPIYISYIEKARVNQSPYVVCIKSLSMMAEGKAVDKMECSEADFVSSLQKDGSSIYNFPELGNHLPTNPRFTRTAEGKVIFGQDFPKTSSPENETRELQLAKKVVLTHKKSSIEIRTQNGLFNYLGTGIIILCLLRFLAGGLPDFGDIKGLATYLFVYSLMLICLSYPVLSERVITIPLHEKNQIFVGKQFFGFEIFKPEVLDNLKAVVPVVLKPEAGTNPELSVAVLHASEEGEGVEATHLFKVTSDKLGALSVIHSSLFGGEKKE
jgi:hypothetical protein